MTSWISGEAPLRGHQRTRLRVVDADHLALELGDGLLAVVALAAVGQVGDQQHLADVVQQARDEQLLRGVGAELALPRQRLGTGGHTDGMQPETLAVMAVARVVGA